MRDFWDLNRAIFPKWSFFDQTAHQFSLEIFNFQKSTWEPIRWTHRLRWWNIFFNPDANLKMAQFNIVEHFSQDIQIIQSDQILNLVSFRLICNLIHKQTNQDRIQFRILALKDDASLPICLFQSGVLLYDHSANAFKAQASL